MNPQSDTFLCSIPLADEQLEVHAFDERWLVPTARAVAAIWTAGNARLRLLRLEAEDLYPLALDQCLSALAAGEGAVAVNGAGEVVGLSLSCDAAAIGGNENAVRWVDPARFSPATRAYKALMDALYEPFVLRFQEFLAAEGYADARGVICYGLKGGVDVRYRGHKLLPLLISVNAVLARRSGFRFYAGIATHSITTAFHQRHALAGLSRTLHQARLADFVDPATGQHPYADAGDLHFFLGITDIAFAPEVLDAESSARLERFHAASQRILAEREQRARQLAACAELATRGAQVSLQAVRADPK